jgi:hypothetical protein
MNTARFLLISILFLSGNILAQGIFKTGNSLLADLRNTDSIDRMIGMGYVLAVHDASSGISVCSPKGITTGQVMEVVKKYLEDNPAHLHRDADVLALKALQVSWPCPKREPSPPPRPTPQPPSTAKPSNPF